jgi:hypothetical protein
MRKLLVNNLVIGQDESSFRRRSYLWNWTVRVFAELEDLSLTVQLPLRKPWLDNGEVVEVFARLGHLIGAAHSLHTLEVQFALPDRVSSSDRDRWGCIFDLAAPGLGSEYPH